MTEERAARYNQGKTPVQYLPIFLVLESMDTAKIVTDEQKIAYSLLKTLSNFQATGNVANIREGLKILSDNKKWGECAEALEFGAKKYAAWNWTKGSNWTVPLSSAVRHAFKIIDENEILDSESGCTHLGHMMCNFVFIRIFMESYPAGNDLPPLNFNMPVIVGTSGYKYDLVNLYSCATNAFLALQDDNVDIKHEDNMIDVLDHIWYMMSPAQREEAETAVAGRANINRST